MTIEATDSFEISGVDASADRGGWQLTGEFDNSQSLVQYGRAAELYELLEGSGVWMPVPNSVIRGSIIPQSLTFNRSQSKLQVTIATADYFLQNAGLQGIYFSKQAVPTNPHQMSFLNLGLIVKHILEQHTNITTATPGGWVDTSGIDIVNSTSVDVFTIRQSNSMWSAIQSIADNEFYVRYFTKLDKFRYESHPQFKAILPTPTASFNVSNIVGEPTITYRNDVVTDQAQLYGLTDNGVILTASYPAKVGTEGRRQKFTNIRCNSQARLNLLAQRAYKYLNRIYNVRLTLAGPWLAYLELYDRVQVTYAGTTRNGVTVNWTNKKFWIAGMRMNKPGRFTATTELELEEENL